MTLPAWLTRTVAAITAAVAIVLAVFAAQRVKGAQRAKRKENHRAVVLEANSETVERAAEKAKVHRAKAIQHAAKAEAIKVATVEKLHELETARGSATARDLADKLNSL